MIHIAIGSDDNYAPHAATLIHSLAKVHAPNTLKFHYYCDDTLTSGVRETLSKFCKEQQVGLQYLDIDPAPFRGLQATAKLPLLCWYRLCLDEYLPDLDRVLYLDTDIVALESVEALFNMEMGDKQVAAINDFYAGIDYREVLERIGVDVGDYFNSGVMLLNLKAIREAGGGKRILDVARDNMERLYFPDQDALNLALGPQSILIDPRWNYPVLTAERLARNPNHPVLKLPACVTIMQPGFKPALLHYLSEPKPWLARQSIDYIWEYFKHRDQTPWPMPFGRATSIRVFDAAPWLLKALRAVRNRFKHD